MVVLADVARALVRLHGAGHIHRDVKARNVLVRRAAAAETHRCAALCSDQRSAQVTADYSTAKLADFGLARPLVRSVSRSRERGGSEEAGGMSPRVGPKKYRAPEVEAGMHYGACMRAAVAADVCLAPR